MKIDIPELKSKEADSNEFFQEAIISEDDFFEEMDDNLEYFPPPPEPEPKPEPESEKHSFFEAPTKEEEEFVGIIDPKIIEALNKDSADLMVAGVDTAMSFILSHFVAKSDEPENYKLPQEQRKKIASIIQKMMPAHKTVMPNWMLLIMTVLNSYGQLTAQAFLERTVKEQDQKIKELEKKIKDREN